MDNKYLNEVLDRLENYQKMMRQIELLQYEIQYASHVTPTEMIEVMTFQKQDADNAGANAIPKAFLKLQCPISALPRSSMEKASKN